MKMITLFESLVDSIRRREAIETLNPHLGDWVFGASRSAKEELLRAYLAMSETLKKALSSYVRELVPHRVTLYRQMKEQDSSRNFDGMSMTENPLWLSGDDVRVYEVEPEDIMVTWRMSDSWLGSRQYAHEQEVILKPGAKPKLIKQGVS